MKKILAIRHVHFEDLGILEPELLKQNFAIEYAEAALTDFTTINHNEYDLMIVLGAPIGASDEALYPFLSAEKDLIEQRINSKKPLIGICLGAQLIARILGAKVYSMQLKEIGFSSLEVNTQITKNPLLPLHSIPVLHWHGDQFDIPKGCQSLASTELCPNQAFQYEEHVLALQFHMEVDLNKIEQWLVGHSHELSTAKINFDQLRADAQKYKSPLSKASKLVFNNWLSKFI